MGYTRRRATMKCWDPHTDTLKFYSSTNFYEHNNKCGKVWSPDYELINDTNIYTLIKLKFISQINP